MDNYDKTEFKKLTGITLSEHYLKLTVDDFVFCKDKDEAFENFCLEWLDDEKDNFIMCHKGDFNRLEEENIRMAAELKRLKDKIYSFQVSDGYISLSVSSKAQ